MIAGKIKPTRGTKIEGKKEAAIFFFYIYYFSLLFVIIEVFLLKKQVLFNNCSAYISVQRTRFTLRARARFAQLSLVVHSATPRVPKTKVPALARLASREALALALRANAGTLPSARRVLQR